MERGHCLVIDYDFYVNSYLGSAIPEKSFSGVAARAADALERIRRQYQVTGDGISEKMAICAMAEAIYAHGGRKPGVAAATVGGVSVRYESSSALEKALLEQARIYLDIYRGASA